MRKETFTDAEGNLRFNFITEDTHHVVATGPASGPVQLNDGTVYDVTPDYVEVEEGHREAVCHHIEKWHERNGTFGPAFKVSSRDTTKARARAKK